jgi:rRNA-processing protein FCF1
MNNESGSKIIVDTSIWIDFLKNNRKIFSLMQKLLEKNRVLAVECIFGELLQGVKSKREKDIVIGYWKYLPKADGNNIWIDAGIYSSENKLLEKGIGLIDSVLIVLAVKNKLKIWTLDKKLKKILPSNLIHQAAFSPEL